jgi:hypothetical protein
MKNLITFIAVLLLFGFTQTVSAQSVPAKVKNYLKANYPDWEITKGCFSDPKIKSKSIVSGDFNGDGKLDYAVAINKDTRDYTLALIATAKGFKSFNLQAIGGDGEHTPMANLAVEKKGGKIAGTSIRLKTDAIIVGECDANLDVHYWQNGKFTKVSVE